MAGPFHSRYDCFPFLRIRQIKHEQMILSGCAANRVPSFAREFQMIGRTHMSQDHAVEAVVILEFAKHVETKAIAVKRHDGREVVGWPGNTQVRR